MTLYKFGDVVLVRFPFSNQVGSKQRPAVVVSSSAYNAGGPDVILVGITSRLRSPVRIGEVRIIDWQEAHLLKPSAIKPVFTTLEQVLIVRDLGTLTEADIARLQVALAEVLG